MSHAPNPMSTLSGCRAALQDALQVAAERGDRLKLIAERLAEFDGWAPAEPRIECELFEGELCDWHNRLLLAVRVAKEIARGKP